MMNTIEPQNVSTPGTIIQRFQFSNGANSTHLALLDPETDRGVHFGFGFRDSEALGCL